MAEDAFAAQLKQKTNQSLANVKAFVKRLAMESVQKEQTANKVEFLQNIAKCADFWRLKLAKYADGSDLRSMLEHLKDVSAAVGFYYFEDDTANGSNGAAADGENIRNKNSSDTLTVTVGGDVLVADLQFSSGAHVSTKISFALPEAAIIDAFIVKLIERRICTLFREGNFAELKSVLQTLKQVDAAAKGQREVSVLRHVPTAAFFVSSAETSTTLQQIALFGDDVFEMGAAFVSGFSCVELGVGMQPRIFYYCPLERLFALGVHPAAAASSTLPCGITPEVLRSKLHAATISQISALDDPSTPLRLCASFTPAVWVPPSPLFGGAEDAQLVFDEGGFLEHFTCASMQTLGSVLHRVLLCCIAAEIQPDRSAIRAVDCVEIAASSEENGSVNLIAKIHSPTNISVYDASNGKPLSAAASKLLTHSRSLTLLRQHLQQSASSSDGAFCFS